MREEKRPKLDGCAATDAMVKGQGTHTAADGNRFVVTALMVEAAARAYLCTAGSTNPLRLQRDEAAYGEAAPTTR